MKNKKEKLEKELLELGLTPDNCKIADEDFDTTYAKILSNDAKELKAYKTRVIKRFNETGNIAMFLDNLKTIAKADNIAELARKSSMHRPNIYRVLSKENDPRVSNLFTVVKNMGIVFKAVAVR
jgi:probable addiction module antidote protein